MAQRIGCEPKVLSHKNEGTESQRAWNECKKNPEHSGFIPVKDFGLKDMPQNFQTQVWLDFIKCLADLTVRLRVQSTSLNRPTSGQFSLDENNSLHTGSSFVGGILDGEGPCPCELCSKDLGDGRRHEWWLVLITTAAHVVFDEHEVKSTNVDLFYDDDAALKRGTMKTFRGFKIEPVPYKVDACAFYCVIHDKAVADVLKAKRASAAELCKSVRTKLGNRDRSAILISHPHGRPKMITVGELTVVSLVDENCYMCAYKARSCPGSSGGHLLWLGDSRMGDCDHGWWFGTHCKSEGPQKNHGARVCIKRNKGMQ